MCYIYISHTFKWNQVLENIFFFARNDEMQKHFGFMHSIHSMHNKWKMNEIFILVTQSFCSNILSFISNYWIVFDKIWRLVYSPGAFCPNVGRAEVWWTGIGVNAGTGFGCDQLWLYWLFKAGLRGPALGTPNGRGPPRFDLIWGKN